MAGVRELRDCIFAKLTRDNDIDYPVDCVNVSVGAKQAIFAAFFASLNPGDEVIVPAPCWVSYPEIVKMANGTPIENGLLRSEEHTSELQSHLNLVCRLL